MPFPWRLMVHTQMATTEASSGIQRKRAQPPFNSTHLSIVLDHRLYHLLQIPLQVVKKVFVMRRVPNSLHFRLLPSDPLSRVLRFLRTSFFFFLLLLHFLDSIVLRKVHVSQRHRAFNGSLWLRKFFILFCFLLL